MSSMRSDHPYKARPIGATNEWLTPPQIIAALGQFDLDPCAAPLPRPWPTARSHICLPQDGLANEWHGRVWCNPPFGRETGKWLKKMALHGNGIALTFARTDTRMFSEWVWPYANGLLFMAGRPHFYRPDGAQASGNSGGPIVLIAYGKNNLRALIQSEIRGVVVKPLVVKRGR